MAKDAVPLCPHCGKETVSFGTIALLRDYLAQEPTALAFLAQEGWSEDDKVYSCQRCRIYVRTWMRGDKEEVFPLFMPTEMLPEKLPVIPGIKMAW